jgi:hypothetical protein
MVLALKGPAEISRWLRRASGAEEFVGRIEQQSQFPANVSPNFVIKAACLYDSFSLSRA